MRSSCVGAAAGPPVHRRNPNQDPFSRPTSLVSLPEVALARACDHCVFSRAAAAAAAATTAAYALPTLVGTGLERCVSTAGEIHTDGPPVLSVSFAGGRCARVFKLDDQAGRILALDELGA